ncbi:ATP-dependent DNA helicase [Pasteurella canis]|uniref:ATP-dependent DNA helicase n=1 Tax=Pasteurella canis TaxID=753 RepID=UPI001E57136B|nr:ATP-dependent RecD-like DNA helicase [Pasteurella canis]
MNSVSKIDKAILDTNKVICENIKRFDDSERGLLSQNILSQLRNLVEYIAQKIKDIDADPNDYQDKAKAIKNLNSNNNYRPVKEFHDLLQKSVSHYTLDQNASERLMLKYYEHLLKIKHFLYNNYSLEILENISDFPLNLDKNLMEYYEKISLKIHKNSNNFNYSPYNDRYYIHKIKPFFINQQIYYEVTFTIANEKISKFDRIIAFTKHDILSNYSVKLHIRDDHIEIFGNKMPIKIIDDWQVSIRPCEFKNFAKIFNSPSLNRNSNEYSALMAQLKLQKMNFVDIIRLPNEYYLKFKQEIANQANTSNFINTLDICRQMIEKDQSGSNIICYLLYHLNNKIIKNQLDNSSCVKLSNLFLKWGCIPFEQMPFTTSLVNHNPKIYDLLDCLDSVNREHEFLARLIKNNAEQNEMLFTLISEIKGFDDITNLIQKYNQTLYLPKHKNRKIIEYKDFLYIKEYVDNCLEIIQKIKNLSLSGINNYTNSVNSWLQNTQYEVDCPEKLGLLKNMFANSRVALIYGAAGTGKTTVINHISKFWNDESKIYLANTNPAVHNLKRKVTANNRHFMTIAKFLASKNQHIQSDLLIIDECSTISNNDMRKILEKAQFQLLILVGDVYQIEAINFGNWFSVIRYFIKNSAVLELTKPYRTTHPDLLMVWERVRNLDMAILEPMVKSNYSVQLDNSILEKTNSDEIILCLNYDGLYGINNINRLLQENNPNQAIQWGVHTYKVNDPILFNESDRFAPLIHNNMKGKIVHIQTEYDKNKIYFDIELDFSINEINAQGYDFELLDNQNDARSIIRFGVNQYPSTDDDNDSFDNIVPFQVAYAVSMHKAQGLEYQSVKIVVTHEVEEALSHNIFYTAITRAKENLKIYWTPETEKIVLSNFKKKNYGRDIGILKELVKDIHIES